MADNLKDRITDPTSGIVDAVSSADVKTAINAFATDASKPQESEMGDPEHQISIKPIMSLFGMGG
jgi:hypothetical protein